ncbi:MAG TPA: tetratricopeptide repeat protein [Polyangiaceae bacterium]|jgi:predicted Zn-dependent protease|nr:tetratricopeptide repeat protein [Polyangiaceae bacterium]
MSKRLEMLEKMAAAGKADAFALYALAMEYRNADRPTEALSTFEKLRETDAGYVPMYLMAGQLLVDSGRPHDAKEWVEAGIEVATSKGDGKARNELVALLADCD